MTYGIKSRIGDTIDTEAVQKFLNETPDWHARCPKCRVTLTGTMAQLKAHKCEVADGAASK